MMKVGDIGVLQNLYLRPQLNGTIAEVIGGYGTYTTRLSAYGLSRERHEGYMVKSYCADPIMGPTGNGWFCYPNQIRPITDPDAEIEKELEMVE